MRVITRFAPSPTGLLHLGHAFSAISAWRRARASGGQFLLRIEDIDPGRCRQEYSDAILDDLAWLGLDWDGPIRVQSRHMAEYGAVLDRWREQGLLYPCFCSRAAVAAEVAQSGSAPHTAPDGALLYPGTCHALDAARSDERRAVGEAHAWRLDMRAALRRIDAGGLWIEDADGGEVGRGEPGGAKAGRRRRCHPEAFGDVVLARRDAPASYHLCAVHDDWVQQVNLVVRGEDLRPAADLHRLLQALAGWTAPAYSHHHLILDTDGRRLSKRDHASSLRAVRESGAPPSVIWAAAGFGGT